MDDAADDHARPVCFAPRATPPWGLAGMLVLLLALESLINRHALALLTVDAWAYRETNHQAAKLAPRADILCFGDSLMKMGAIPQIVGEHAGFRVVNLAVSGSQAAAAEALLRGAIERGARPRAVVVEYFPPLMNHHARFNNRYWSFVLDHLEAARLTWDAADPSVFGWATVGRVLASVRGRDGIRTQLMSALQGKPDPTLWANVMYRRNWRINSGAQIAADRPSEARLDEARAQAWNRQYFDRFRCDPSNLPSIRRFLELARAHDIRVYWLLPPYVPIVQAGCEASGFDAAHVGFVREWRREFPALSVIDARRAGSDPEGYFDPHHLGARGATGFSRALGDTLRSDLASNATHPSNAPGRWLTLAPFRPEDLPLEVEDLERSSIALRENGKKTTR